MNTQSCHPPSDERVANMCSGRLSDSRNCGGPAATGNPLHRPTRAEGESGTADLFSRVFSALIITLPWAPVGDVDECQRRRNKLGSHSRARARELG
jgi:hypothetical protein